KAILALSSFAMGGQDDIDLMERAIRVLIAGKMTEKKAKKLAEWVKDGNSPEDFAGSNAQKAKSSKEDGDGQDGPYARQWQELKETGYFQIKGPSKGSIHIIIPDEGSGVAAAFGAAGAIWALRQAHSPEQS